MIISKKTLSTLVLEDTLCRFWNRC